MGDYIEERSGVPWPTLTQSWVAAAFLIWYDNTWLNRCVIFPSCYLLRWCSVIFPTCLCSSQPQLLGSFFVLQEIVGDCSGPWPFSKLCRKGFWLIIHRNNFLSQVAVPPIWNPLLFCMSCSLAYDIEEKLQSSGCCPHPHSVDPSDCIGQRTDVHLPLDSFLDLWPFLMWVACYHFFKYLCY